MSSPDELVKKCEVSPDQYHDDRFSSFGRDDEGEMHSFQSRQPHTHGGKSASIMFTDYSSNSSLKIYKSVSSHDTKGPQSWCSWTGVAKLFDLRQSAASKKMNVPAARLKSTESLGQTEQSLS